MRTWPADLPIDVAISFTTCAKPQTHTNLISVDLSSQRRRGQAGEDRAGCLRRVVPWASG